LNPTRDKTPNKNKNKGDAEDYMGSGIAGAGEKGDPQNDDPNGNDKGNNDNGNDKDDPNGNNKDDPNGNNKDDPNGNNKDNNDNGKDGFNAEPIVIIATPISGAGGDPKILDSGKNKVDAFYQKGEQEQDGSVTPGGGMIYSKVAGALGNELFCYDLDARTEKEIKNDQE
jgi:hypothetical protein